MVVRKCKYFQWKDNTDEILKLVINCERSKNELFPMEILRKWKSQEIYKKRSVQECIWLHVCSTATCWNWWIVNVNISKDQWNQLAGQNSEKLTNHHSIRDAKLGPQVGKQPSGGWHCLQLLCMSGLKRETNWICCASVCVLTSNYHGRDGCDWVGEHSSLSWSHFHTASICSTRKWGCSQIQPLADPIVCLISELRQKLRTKDMVATNTAPKWISPATLLRRQPTKMNR